jgi:prepilin-type N-terminal cleavage/methylation domain-containing protein
MHRARRSGYTLLEVLLALLIGVLLLAAVYGAVGYQIEQAQAGRDLVEQSNQVRSVVAKMESDIVATVGLSDPARFRNQNKSQGGGGGGGATTPSTTTPSTTTTTTTPSTASGSGTSGQTTTATQVVLPLGVIGDSSSLTLFITRVPSDAWPGDDNQNPVVSDLRRVTYWLDGSNGLCRQELRVVTSQDALDTSIPPGNVDPAKCLVSRRVESLEISYYDGTNWQDTWDSTALGADNVTPMGSPRAIALRLGLRVRRSGTKQTELKHYRHVVVIQTANGATQANNPADMNNSGTTTGQ